ncbi:G/U mismatch-specific DNA glycosylase [Pseudomonas sp. PCH199]|uniref:G/U mismatch-specific DNA glycosylase n=1 Tax=unclassified Pseudomonas TaxID=196821 RepID=UPI0015AA9655|nr:MULTISPECIES: G/U mismatch-specific DNA glycosylase [unclassified Pseudomonas]MCW8278115.1 G/U mismatch-specific DNA glycosylase [Pseudomonas sp. PCH199]
MSEGLEDILAERLAVIFCGINPGVLAAAQGHHFAGRGNRFWRTLHLAGFTPEEVRPENDRTILHFQCGLTAVVERPTARADQLSLHDSSQRQRISNRRSRAMRHVSWRFSARRRTRRYRVSEVAWGLQAKTFGNAAVWVLPNPSGRNRAFSLDQLVDAYSVLRLAAIDPAQ